MRVSVTGWLLGHQCEAQQMILAAAALVQLGLPGNVPQKATTTREEHDTGRKRRDNAHSCQIGKQIKKIVLLCFSTCLKTVYVFCQES